LLGAINSGCSSANPIRRVAELHPPEAGATTAFVVACQAVALAKAGPQIFFKAGEGLFKGVVVLPVGEIGDVIFVDFSCRAEAERRWVRQIFAGVRATPLCDKSYNIPPEAWANRFAHFKQKASESSSSIVFGPY